MMITNRYIRATVLAALLLMVAGRLQAQEWSVKTNLLSDVATVPSVSSEYRISLRWTTSLDFSWMPVHQMSEHFIRTIKFQPEAHYWLRAPFTGPFIGPSLQWRLYNIGGVAAFRTSDSRSQGYVLGAGCTAGWHFTLSNRWGLEPSVTLGYAYTHYHRYDSPRDDRITKKWDVHYLGPIAAAVQLVYMLR
jgi:hypothetical protein